MTAAARSLEPREPGGARALAALLALALVVKGAFVLALADVFFYGEELEKGAAAKAMLDGLGVPHHQLAYHYYEGGGFVVSHLKALAFLLVGENLLAHKLVAMAFFLAVLAAGYAVVRELFGRRAAWWFGLLLVFGPISFQKLSLLSLGIHFEACLFLALAMWTTARLAFDAAAPARRWFALGLVVGLGLYFSYQLAIAALWGAAALVVTRPRDVFGRGGVLGTAGFLVGAAPLGLMALLVGGAVFDIHGTALSGAGEELSRGARVTEFLRSLLFERGGLEIAGAVVFPLAVVVALAVALRARGAGARELRRGTVFLGSYLALFGAVYLSSAFVQGEVYHFFVLLRLAPAWFVGTMLVAGAIGWLADSAEAGLPGARAQARSLAAAPLAVGVASAAAVLAGGRGSVGANLERLVETRGYAYAPYFAKLVPHLDGDQHEQLAVLLRFDEEDRDGLRAEIAAELFGRARPSLRVAYAAARTVVEERDPGSFDAYELGLGRLFLDGNGWDLAAALESVGEAPEANRARLCEALGRFGSGPAPAEDVLFAELALAPRAPVPEAYARGVGWRVREGMPLDEPRARGFLARLPEHWEVHVSAGYEAALAAVRLR